MIIIPGHLEILTTPEWGAKPPKHAPEIRDYAFKGGILHHTAGANHEPTALPSSQKRNAIALAQSIQRSHMEVNGWNDSGMSFLVSVDAVITEGRAGTINALKTGKTIVQAHCADDNHWFNDWIGVEVEGNHMSFPVNDKQLDAVIRVFAWTSILANYDTSVIQGHRSALPGATLCPGDWLADRTGMIRKAVHEKKLEFIKLGVKKP